MIEVAEVNGLGRVRPDAGGASGRAGGPAVSLGTADEHGRAEFFTTEGTENTEEHKGFPVKFRVFRG
ncbi:MAG: hypothetical protein LBW77_06070 [Verrucomicrobiota bacterium]|jgi:hypothetical protein|nr:hypothetical protein [Verrucomicrobiota bacterium]